jgi:hypothetical protein
MVSLRYQIALYVQLNHNQILLQTFYFCKGPIQNIFALAEIYQILNERDAEGYRFVGIQTLWARDSEYNAIQRNFLVLGKEMEEDL